GGGQGGVTAGAGRGEGLGGQVRGAEHGGGLRVRGGAGGEGRGPAHQLPRAAADDGRQVAGEVLGARVALLAVLGEGREEHLVHLRRDRGVEHRGRLRRLPHVLVGDGDGGVAGERRAAREHLVQHAGGGVE